MPMRLPLLPFALSDMPPELLMALGPGAPSMLVGPTAPGAPGAPVPFSAGGPTPGGVAAAPSPAQPTPEEQLQQLLGGQPLDEQARLLQEQRAQAAALGNRPMHEYKTPFGAAVGGLADVLAGVGAAAKERDVAELEAGLRGKTAKARELYSKAAGGAAMPEVDYGSLFSSDAQTAQDAAKRLSEGLRGQRQLGMQGVLSGDPVLSRVGTGVLEEIARREQLAGQVGRYRLEKSLAAEQEAAKNARELKEQQERDAAQFERQKEIARITAGQSATTRAAERAAEDARRKADAEEKAAHDDFAKMTQDLSTTRSRGNLNAERQKRLDAAERLEALILGPGGQIQNLTRQQVREAATALANLISQGSVSEHQIEELTPESYASKWSDLKQKVLNEPHGADAQAFLENMLETAARETAVTRQQIRRGQLQALPNYAHLRTTDPAKYESILHAVGIDPASVDERGLPRETRVIGGKTYFKNARGRWEAHD